MARRAFLKRLALAGGGALAGIAVLAGVSGCTSSVATLSAPTAAQPAATTVTVDAAACIGCKRCVAVAPEAFRMNAKTNKAEIIPGAPAAAIKRGAAACPVDAIH